MSRREKKEKKKRKRKSCWRRSLLFFPFAAVASVVTIVVAASFSLLEDRCSSREQERGGKSKGLSLPATGARARTSAVAPQKKLVFSLSLSLSPLHQTGPPPGSP